MQPTFSKALLFFPCGIFIGFNILSAFYITTNEVYNGDYLGIPLEHSIPEVWLFCLISSLPYILLYALILKIKPLNVYAEEPPTFFLSFSVLILILSLLLTLTYGVGMMAQGIYSVPSLLKPFVVIINRIDVLVLSFILILSPYIKWRYAILVGLLICSISFYRGSLMFLPVVLFLFFFRFMTYKNYFHTTRKTNRFWIIIFFSIIVLTIGQNISLLYELRESIRGLESKEFALFELIFGKLIGRLSNLSSLLRYDLFYNDYLDQIHRLSYFAFLVDCLKGIWGGFISSPVMNHYDYWTLINDPWGFRVYAQQTGLIPALGLSFMKSPIIGVFDILILIICIYYVVRMFTYFLGIQGKYAAMILLIFSVLSGAPNQFSNPLIHLLILILLFLFFRFFVKEFNSRS